MIELEDFKKLKQNDRIEFMLRWNHLDKKEDSLYFNFLPMVCFIFAIICFIVLLILQFLILELYEGAIKLFSILEPLTIAIFIVIFFGVLWNIIWSIKFSKYKKELEEEFFKTETKPRK